MTIPALPQSSTAPTSQELRRAIRECGYDMVAVRYPQIDGSDHRTLIYYINGEQGVILEIITDHPTRVEKSCKIYAEVSLETVMTGVLGAAEKTSTSTPSQPLAGEAALLHELLSECEPRIIREALEIAMGCPDAETALIQHYRESLTDYQNALKEEEADEARERRFQAEY